MHHYVIQGKWKQHGEGTNLLYAHAQVAKKEKKVSSNFDLKAWAQSSMKGHGGKAYRTCIDGREAGLKCLSIVLADSLNTEGVTNLFLSLVSEAVQFDSQLTCIFQWLVSGLKMEKDVNWVSQFVKWQSSYRANLYAHETLLCSPESSIVALS